jgi:thiol-disulfide isomerase/thioredoxin
MNIKLLFSLGAVCLSLASCQSKSFKINGSVEGLEDGDTLFLTSDLQMGIPSDTLVVKDGRFTFKGETDSTYLCMIYGASRNEINTPFFLEPGAITIHLTERPGGSRIGGTKCNDAWQELNDSVMTIGKEINLIAEHIYGRIINQEEQQKGMEQIIRLNQHFADIVVNAAEKNIKNEFGYLLLTYYPEQLINNSTRMKLIEKLPEEMRQRQAIKQIEQELRYAAKTAVGATIPDFSQTTPDGTGLNIMSEVKQHKITIIDFWASWCGPCRQQMPFMIEIYHSLKDKGLGIVGVSLDKNRDAWISATKQFNITWPQMSDLKGWENAVVQEFNITSIPYTIVVDQQGKILERGLRGKRLKAFIEEQLKI